MMRMAVVLLGLLAGQVAAMDTDELAKAYGAREAAKRMRISPDGHQLLYFVPASGGGTAVKVADIDNGGSRVVLASNTASEQPFSCGWKSAARILCQVGVTSNNSGILLGFARTLSLATDGSGGFILGPREDQRDIGIDQRGARVIDWLPDDPEHVLMQVNIVNRFSTGSKISGSKPGLAVQKFNVLNNRATTVESGDPLAESYGTDEHGNVRFMQHVGQYENGIMRDQTKMMVRSKDNRNWQVLARERMSEQGQVDFHGFDETGEAVLLTKSLDGRAALYRQAPDGEGEEELLFAHPIVDVDGVWRIGKYRRPVAARYSVEANELAFFDAALEQRAKALSGALPGNPPVSILDESWDGRYNLVFAGGDRDAGTYYRFDTQALELNELLKVRPQLGDWPTAVQKPVRFEAADGTAIPGYLTLPPGREEAKGLPSIVMPHGGPASRDVLGFDWLAQFFAQNGFAVLQPNFRGSSGYGADWYQSNGFQSWEVAIGDVNAGAHWLVGEGIADPAKLAIFGWSYGGYAALQANVLEPSLYKAAVAVAPVTDLELMKTLAQRYTTAVIVERFIGSGPHVVAGSPAQQAARIAAPVLMFHGDFDQNVDIKQSRAMASALKGAGKRHELVEYEGLAHNLDDDAARVEMLTRSLDWIRAEIAAAPALDAR